VKFGDLLALEYENAEFRAVHELTVDAYALQHPGEKSSQTLNSANVHLTGLYSSFVLGIPIKRLHEVKKEVANHKDRFVWLDPPDNMGDITVADVLKSRTAVEHCAKVKEWAEYIFEKWNIHHSTIANILAINT
jgi:hypothetical protein